MSGAPPPLVSVVIAARDAAGLLGDCLASLAALEPPRAGHEVLAKHRSEPGLARARRVRPQGLARAGAALGRARLDRVRGLGERDALELRYLDLLREVGQQAGAVAARWSAGAG